MSASSSPLSARAQSHEAVFSAAPSALGPPSPPTPLHFTLVLQTPAAAMPPSFVTCYICGREFGTRSIGIHVPKCAAKWEAQQEQLPRVRRTRAGSGNTMTSCVQGERRAVPAAPANFDKILRGELRGAELARVNQQAAEDYNTSALETCSHCGRSANIKHLHSAVVLDNGVVDVHCT